MKIKTLDDIELDWKPKSNPRSIASDLHLQAISLLKKLYPSIFVCEEVLAPIFSNRKPLSFDIFIPIFNLAIEVQGVQHYKYVGFFFKNKRDFRAAQYNDECKRLWCTKNEIRLLELNYDCIGEWQRQIQDAIG